jgi:hypothetical protein
MSTGYGISFAYLGAGPSEIEIGGWATFGDKWCSVGDIDEAADGDETYYELDVPSRHDMHRLVDALFDKIGKPAPDAWPYFTDEQLAAPMPSEVIEYTEKGSMQFEDHDGVITATSCLNGVHHTSAVTREQAHTLLGQYVNWVAAQ